jgi:hypothetical protein
MAISKTSTLEYIAQWATVVGVPFLLVQLYFTQRSARNAASEAKGTRTAIERTERQLANNHLLVRAAEMDRFRERLDSAVQGNRNTDAAKILREWPNFANDGVAILTLIDATEHVVAIRQLKDSMSAAVEAKDRLIGEQISVEEATRESRDLIEQACAAVAEVASTLKFTRSTSP